MKTSRCGMKLLGKAICASLLAALAFSSPLSAQTTITTFSSLGAFTTAVGAVPMTVEDFTSTTHIPISTGVLNSFTNLPAVTIFPGTIQPGVTYSTPIGIGNFFNIDAGGGFSTPFLDTVTAVGPLTVTFTGPIRAFGFDTNTIMGTTLAITINFTSGTPYTNTFAISGAPFFGFESNSANIASVLIGGGTGGFTFAIDNFRFTSVPEPDTCLLLVLGLAAIVGLRRRCT